MFRKKNLNGITEKTVENLQLDAGVFFKNYEIGTDTYASAKAAGKCIGATTGGGEFTAKAVLRQIEVDGAGARVKGLTDVDSWDVVLKITTKEITLDNLLMAFGVADTDTDSVEGYTKISGRMGMREEDYITNITWVGTLTGTEKPIIIQVFNCLNEDGFAFSVKDKAEGQIALNFYGYNSLDEYMDDSVNPPYAVYYPSAPTEASNETTKSVTE